MVPRRSRCLCLALFLLAGCTAGAAERQRAARDAPPSAQDVSNAMRDGLPPLVDDTASYQCPLVLDLQCTPAGQDRFQCSYKDAGNVRRVAVVERQRETDYRGPWRWVRGWRRCGILY